MFHRPSEKRTERKPTLTSIQSFVNVAAMRGIGNVKIPRIIATICILILNPICGWLLTIVLEKGV